MPQSAVATAAPSTPGGFRPVSTPTTLSGAMPTPGSIFNAGPVTSVNGGGLAVASPAAANTNIASAAPSGSESGKTGSGGGLLPPTNDIVNTAIGAGGLAAPMGTGFIADVLKGLFQQFGTNDDSTASLQANTNNMSLVDRAVYGPGLGEQFVNWVSSIFGGNGAGQATQAFDPATTQITNSGMQSPLAQAVQTLPPSVTQIGGGTATPSIVNTQPSAIAPDLSGLVAGNAAAGVPFGYGTDSNPFSVIGGDAGSLAESMGGGGGGGGEVGKQSLHTYFD